MTNLVPNVYAALATTMFAAAVALAFRLRARQITKMHLWYDDYAAVLGFICGTGYCSTLFYWTTHYRFGQSIADLSPSESAYVLERSRLLMWISELFYANSIAATKFAALLFYYKMFRFTAIRIPIYVLFVTITIWIILRTFLVIFQCVPVEAIWDKTIPDPTCNIDTSKFFFGTVLTHCLMDIAIVLLPAFPVVKMQLPPAQKIAVIGLFACGTMVCIASVFVLIESINYDPNSKEMPHDVALNFVWGGVETNLAVFSACLPLLRPVFRKIIPGLKTRSSDNQATSEASFAFRGFHA